ncbi:hypothetical protein OG572_39580 [Streptomyces virginiae]|uniref:hypothetical protein n=1 Tax=Streptomyces virginiae TaxID=1961 RepID=UPI0032468572
MHRTTAEGGYRINDGGYSFRSPANRFAWSATRPARADRALAPDGAASEAARTARRQSP